MEQTTKALPRLGFSEAIKKNFSSLTDIKGRSRRSELWWNFLLYIIISMVINTVLSALPLVQGIAAFIVQLVIMAAVTVRRLHDRGQSGLWVAASFALGLIAQIYICNSGFYELMNSLNPDPNKIVEILTQPALMILGVISFVVNIVILVFCLMDSKPEENKYGPSPKYVTEE